MVRLRSPAPYGGFPEWPKGADCKSVVSDFGGPNPPSPTKNPAPVCGIFSCFAPPHIPRIFRRSRSGTEAENQKTNAVREKEGAKTHFESLPPLYASRSRRHSFPDAEPGKNLGNDILPHIAPADIPQRVQRHTHILRTNVGSQPGGKAPGNAAKCIGTVRKRRRLPGTERAERPSLPRSRSRYTASRPRSATGAATGRHGYGSG